MFVGKYCYLHLLLLLWIQLIKHHDQFCFLGTLNDFYIIVVVFFLYFFLWGYCRRLKIWLFYNNKNKKRFFSSLLWQVGAFIVVNHDSKFKAYLGNIWRKTVSLFSEANKNNHHHHHSRSHQKYSNANNTINRKQTTALVVELFKYTEN